jgi:hypothetical protein
MLLFKKRMNIDHSKRRLDMVPIMSLWVPILLSAVFVFVISFAMHTLLSYHRNDYVKIPGEDDVMNALSKIDIPPGDYMMPYADSREMMRSPEFIKKMNKGPVAFMTVVKPGQQSMGVSLLMWFVFNVIVSIFAAYVAGRALGPGARFWAVVRFAGTVTFTSYALAMVPNSIWYKIKWSTTLKSVIDGLILSLVTGAIFGWLWPAVKI